MGAARVLLRLLRLLGRIEAVSFLKLGTKEKKSYVVLPLFELLFFTCSLFAILGFAIIDPKVTLRLTPAKNKGKNIY